MTSPPMQVEDMNVITALLSAMTELENEMVAFDDETKTTKEYRLSGKLWVVDENGYTHGYVTPSDTGGWEFVPSYREEAP